MNSRQKRCKMETDEPRQKRYKMETNEPETKEI